MKITIEKSGVLEQLHLLSAQLGLKLQAPDVVASVADDEERIESLWMAAAMELAHTLAPYCTYMPGENGAEYNLALPDNWKDGLSDDLRESCREFILHSLLARWLYFVHPESAGIYKAMNVETASAIVNILAMRRKPQVAE